jgi:hypothetical protein
MQRRSFVLGLVHTALFSTARIGSAEPQPHVAFLNPGEPVERGTGPYWRMVTPFLLMLRLGNQEPRIIGIPGDPRTPASMERADRGVALAAHGGLAQKFDHMYVVHRENVSRFSDVAFKRTEALGFRVYSKALNPGPGPYDFRLAPFVEPGTV